MLGGRLRELRVDAHLTGRDLADRLGWPQSKISKLETGRQTATEDDVRAWARGTGSPAASELVARLRTLETHYRSWRRQLAAGHAPVQDALRSEYERSHVMRAWEGAMIVGVLQTAEYARHIFAGYQRLHQSVRDLDDAVRARIRRQDVLYAPGKQFHIVMSEAALSTLVCPPAVMLGQLDRLAGVIGMDTVRLGFIPLGARLEIPPANAFWVFDDRLVIAEDWHAELWLEEGENVALYLRVWQMLADSAVFGQGAQHVIARARRSLPSS
nr:helix-turn-helix transcriptional regulator [Streptomyces sp. SID3343]